MQIPNNLPQFENHPALFLSAGEYEANFFLALNGKLTLKRILKMPPRTEAKEKQAFEGKAYTLHRLGAVSHRGAYIEDLKKKFSRSVHLAIHDLMAIYHFQEIYFFTPKYVSRRIVSQLDGEEKKKIRMKFFTQKIKENPLEMIEAFWQEEQQATKRPASIKKAEKKILARPKIKRARIE